MLNILVVEDEIPISDLVRLSLTKEGYRCVCAFDGMEAADCLEKDRYDLILLDVMLPEIDGFTLMDYIRPLEIPVIFLTAKASVEDRVKGLKLGAEDYIVKPFEVVELLARIDVVLRRYKKCDMMLEISNLKIDTVSMQVWRDGAEVSLTKTEYELLLLFARNPRRAMYRETIYERIWGEEYPFGSKAVDIHIQRLRKKVGWENCLRAVNKVGYRLEVEP